MTAKLCHFEPFAKRRPNGLQGATKIHIVILSVSEKSIRILKYALDLWILRQRLSMTKKSAQYDKIYRYDKKIKPTCLQIFLSFFVNFTILQEN